MMGDVNERLNVIRSLENPHIFKPLVSLETVPVGPYYILFPSADSGSLEEFWNMGDWKPRPSELLLWALQQMACLMGGLKTLHDLNIRHSTLRPTHVEVKDMVFSRALNTLREDPRCATGTGWHDLIDILDSSVLTDI